MGDYTQNEFFYRPHLGADGEDQRGLLHAGFDLVDTRLGHIVYVGDPIIPTTIGNPFRDAVAYCNALASSVTLCVPAGTYTVNANTTANSTVSIVALKGATITISTGCTLTLNCQFHAGPYKVFAWAGTGAVSFGTGSVSKAYFRWWGATGDGTTDDTSALQAAITACSPALAPLYGVSKDVYLTGPVTFPQNVVMGGGWNICGAGATLKQKDQGNIFDITTAQANHLTIIDKWRFLGSTAYVWKKTGVAEPAVGVTFDGISGVQVGGINLILATRNWYWAANTLYVYVLTTTTLKEPENVYSGAGIQVDGGAAITDWTKHFAGRAVNCNNSNGISDVRLTNVHVNYMDVAYYLGYGIRCGANDCLFVYNNTGLYGVRNTGASHAPTFDRVKIAQCYGTAIYFSDANALSFNDITADIHYGRTLHLYLCNDINFNGWQTEALAWHDTTTEAVYLDTCSNIQFDAGSSWFAGTDTINKYSGATAIFKLVNGCRGIRVKSRLKTLTQAGVSTVRGIYSTDGVDNTISFDEAVILGSSPQSLSLDYNPVADWVNGSIFGSQGALVIARPAGLVRIKNAYNRNMINYALSPSCEKMYSTVYTGASGALDNTAGYGDLVSYKFTWSDTTNQIYMSNCFTKPGSGTYYGVVSFYAKADANQVVSFRLANYMSSDAGKFGLSSDGVWRHVTVLLSSSKDLASVNPHGFILTSNVGAGNLWIDDFDVRYFNTAIEAHQYCGCVYNRFPYTMLETQFAGWRSGYYYSALQTCGPGNGGTITANKIYAIRLAPRLNSVNLQNIGVNRRNPVVGNARVGIYEDNGSCYPGSLVTGTDGGALSMNGANYISNACTITLAPDKTYWLAFLADCAADLYRLSYVYLTNVEGSLSLGSSNPTTCLWDDLAYGALPSTFPGTAVGTTGYMPGVWVQVA